MKTLNEILHQLKQIDEVTLIEMFRVNSEDLVDRFQDIIENDTERYSRELEQFFPETEEDEEDFS